MLPSPPVPPLPTFQVGSEGHGGEGPRRSSFLFSETNPQIRLVPPRIDTPVFDGLDHGATRFVKVRAVAEGAVAHQGPDLTEIAVQFVRLDVPQGEGLQPGCVGEITRSEEHTSELQSQSNIVCP